MANIDNVQLPDGSSYNIVDNTSGFATQNYVDSAVSSITKTTIGLGNVDNTSDLNKPISTATQTALDTLDEDKADKTDIATVESGTTASRTYSVGELVYVSGTLYRVKTAIASGATFTVGTNVEETNISSAIQPLSIKVDLTATDTTNKVYTGSLDDSKFKLFAIVLANIENVGWVSVAVPKVSGHITLTTSGGNVTSSFYGFITVYVSNTRAVTVTLTSQGAGTTKILAAFAVYY